MLVILAGSLFGSFAAIMVRYSTAPSLVLAAYRKVMVTAMLLPFVLVKCRDELRRLNRKTVIWCCVSGFFLAIHFFTYYESVKHTTIAASQMLTGMEILFVAAFMLLSGKERYGAAAAAGIIIALLGGILVGWTQGGAAAPNAVYGNLCALACALFSAVYSLIGMRVRVHCSTTVYTFLVYGASAAVLTVMVPLGGYSYFGYGAVNYAVAFGLAVFCSLLSHSLFNWAVKYQSPTLITIVKQLQPVLAVVWGLLIFAEVPLWNQLVGGIVLTGGIILYTAASGRPAAAARGTVKADTKKRFSS